MGSEEGTHVVAVGCGARHVVDEQPDTQNAHDEVKDIPTFMPELLQHAAEGHNEHECEPRPCDAEKPRYTRTFRITTILITISNTSMTVTNTSRRMKETRSALQSRQHHPRQRRLHESSGCTEGVQQCIHRNSCPNLLFIVSKDLVRRDGSGRRQQQNAQSDHASCAGMRSNGGVHACSHVPKQ